MKSATLLTASLLSTFILTACSSGNVSVSGVNPAQLKTAVSQSATTSLKTETKAQLETSESIKLQPISQETVKQQASLRQSKTTLKAEEDSQSAEEAAEIRKLLAQAESKIAEEDRAQAKTATNAGFRTKTVEQGKDVDIELFLYHPKYGSKAKSWGIKNANDFLMAARSPWRRFTLKLKLEGLFAPKGFNQQVLFWAEQADLLRISGVSKDQAWLLVANGVTSVPDLARRNVIDLGAMLVSLKLMAFQYGMDAPSMSELQDWAEEAQTMEPVIY